MFIENIVKTTVLKVVETIRNIYIMTKLWHMSILFDKIDFIILLYNSEKWHIFMLLSFKLSDLPLLNDKKMSKHISTHTHDISQALILIAHLKLKF